MASPRIFRGLAAAFLSVFFISAHCAPASQVALSQSQLQEIDNYLADYYSGVLITKRTLNDQDEVISCVDVGKQPGAKNSAQVQLEPSDALKAQLGGHVSQAPPSKICPRGSVEMRLPTREQIISKGGLKKFLQKDSNDSARPIGPPPPPAAPNPTSSDSSLVDGHYWAIVNLNANATGAQSTLSLWKPVVPSVANPGSYFLFSLSQIWVNGGGFTGGSGLLQSVESGTHVYQFIYKDVESHFFIYWTADDYDVLKCQDLRCAAFVVTSSILPIGGKLAYSTTGGTTLEGTIAWYRDPATGNWILFLYDSVNGYRQVGYYPASLFGSGQLSKYATRVSFGGEVYTPPADAPKLPMGSGNNPLAFSGGLVGNVAYQRGLKYMNTSGSMLDVTSSWIKTTPDNSGCAYGTRFYPANAPYAAGWGSTVFYGGKGFDGTCIRP